MTGPHGPERLERDSLGEVLVPADALYGAQTARAVASFAISGRPLPRALVHALGEIKAACAEASGELGLLPRAHADAVRLAAGEVAAGEHDGAFPVDVFQTGSGTSSNMNANEVVANRANELLGGGPRGTWRPLHPNDHVNLGQSSNDVFPTAIHVAAARAVQGALLPALGELAATLRSKARELDPVLKLGRTHLMDALPVRLGQELAGHAGLVERARDRVAAASRELLEVPLGGTAVGTGAGAPEGFAPRALAALAARTRLALVAAREPFEAQSSRGACAALSAATREAASALAKIANDLRLLGSGPEGGIAEVVLPALQPGSSIMPGKVNPVVPEAVRQVWLRAHGNDAVVSLANALGELELNVLAPVLAEALLDSLALTANAAVALARLCVAGLAADAGRCRALVERSSALATALVPAVGYERAALIAARARRERRTVREVARELALLPEETLDRLLDPRRLSGPTPRDREAA